MKRIWLISALVITAIATAVGGVTFAWFAATTGPSTNDFTAGTVSLSGYRGGMDTVNGPMFYITAQSGANQDGANGLKPTGVWVPGNSQTRVLQVENTGTVDAQLKTLSTTVTGDEALARALAVQVCDDLDCTSVRFSGSLWSLTQGAQSFSPPLVLAAGTGAGDGDVATLYFQVTLPRAAGNELQDNTLQAAFQVYADQVRNNP